ncbi:hypothetical protein LTR27_002463 [Elasticomyces elasticus]|nr:hypothetical protein LTR27_002463 [Elasticomyces elasticus]
MAASSSSIPRGRINPEIGLIDEPELLPDGGGIRGYWSLLAVKKLMEYVARSEENHGEPHLHSFQPEPLPHHVCHVPLADSERDRQNQAHYEDDRIAALAPSKRYLPCHYFDYIGGSSTGGLIAIMLGRLRMTVPDCIHEYETLGEAVFGKPRTIHQLRIPMVHRNKYDSNALRKVFEDVVSRRAEVSLGGSPRFPSSGGMCRTMVTTLRSTKDKDGHSPDAKAFVIRSFSSPDSPIRRNTSSGPSRHNTGQSSASGNGSRRRQLKPLTKGGPAHDFEIWEVARAATAAPFYFDPIEIMTNGGTEANTFEDGGFGGTPNNPTNYGIREIEQKEGPKAIGVVVSVGTARGDRVMARHKDRIDRKLKRMVNVMSDPDVEHKLAENNREDKNYEYFRLNPGVDEESHRLNVELDEWLPRRANRSGASGHRTIDAIKRSFSAWLESTEVQDYMMDCAQHLVDSRRRRLTDPDHLGQWARYAAGTEYRCREMRCSKPERSWSDRDEFAGHLQRDHHMQLDDETQRHATLRWQYRAPGQSSVAKPSRLRNVLTGR